MTRVYLDWNATAPLRPEARAAMNAAMDQFGNPSSPHSEGRAARAILERAREQVAALVGATPAEVSFTSGATEAANWALLGRRWSQIRMAEGEHAAVRQAALAAAGAGMPETAPLDEHGAPLGETAGAPLNPDALFCGWEAQGETGVAMAPGETAEIAQSAGAPAFTDATQLAGKQAFNRDGAARSYRFDTALAAISGHKFGGPKGVGALLIREGVDLDPLIRGGGQEMRRRSGTENVIGAAGMGAAAEAALRDQKAGLWESVRALRDMLEARILAATPGALVIGRGAPWRLANTLAVALRGSRAESLLIRLDMAGVAVSAGSACSSGKMTPSPVLAAMGLDPETAQAALRFSLGPTTTEDDVDRAAAAWAALRLTG